jgi:hypothetical protein
MSLTSYRAAPPRVVQVSGVRYQAPGGERECLSCFLAPDAWSLSSEDLAATYSPASWDAVPSALRVFTAEFGMGSGVWPLAMTTRSSEDRKGQKARNQKRVRREHESCSRPNLLAFWPSGFWLLNGGLRACKDQSRTSD